MWVVIYSRSKVFPGSLSLIFIPVACNIFLVFPGINFVIFSLFFFKYFYRPLSISFHKSLHCSFTTENEGNSENLFNLFTFVQLLQFLKLSKRDQALTVLQLAAFLATLHRRKKTKDTKSERHVYSVSQ